MAAVITATQTRGRAFKWFDNEAGRPAGRGTAGALTGAVFGWITDVAPTSQSAQTGTATAGRTGTETVVMIGIATAMAGTAETKTQRAA